MSDLVPSEARHIAVTGASSGIARAIAIELAKVVGPTHSLDLEAAEAKAADESDLAASPDARGAAGNAGEAHGDDRRHHLDGRARADAGDDLVQRLEGASLAAASEALHGELRGTGVHRVTVYPGILATEMADAATGKYESSAIPRVQPVSTAEQLAKAIRTAIEKKEERLIYPRFNIVARWFHAQKRWVMDRLTPAFRKTP